MATLCRGNKTHNASSLIDVVLHNSSLVCSSSAVNFPFSDHAILAVKLKLQRVKYDIDLITSRKLNSDNKNLIGNTIIVIDFSILDTIIDINLRWHVFKKLTLNIIDSVAPFKKPRRKHKCVPWYDEYFLEKKKQLAKLFKRYYLSYSADDLNAFRSARAKYQSSFRKIKLIILLIRRPIISSHLDDSGNFIRPLLKQKKVRFH
jgi:hypothetical protein